VVVVVVVLAAGAALWATDPLATRSPAKTGVTDNADPTSLATVARQNLSSQAQLSGTLGYAGSYTIAAPSGTSTQQIAKDQQTVTQDQQTMAADQQTESDQSSADDQQVTAAQTNVSTASATLTSDHTTQAQDCAGTGASGATCSQDAQQVNQDQTALTQAQQQLSTAQASATGDAHQNQAKVAADQTTLQGDQATLVSDLATEMNPGTTYTWLPSVGAVIKEDQPVYSLSNQPVPLLYGSIAAYRAFYVGMSDGADVGELTQDLIALGYGAGLSQSDHYSSATAAAVERWQAALGLAATSEVLLGQVVFEPGPIQVASVTPSVGASAGGGSASSGSGSGGGVLTATSTTPEASIALDPAQQSEVAVGDKVSIVLPNNQTTPGVISSVGTVATTPSSSGNDSSGSSSNSDGGSASTPTITVQVTPTNPPSDGSWWDQAAVSVTVTTATAHDALVVPVDALLALANGGYAVEAVGANGIHHLVDVSLGMFDDADGLVQITSSGLSVGEKVVVPAT
jgi:hypothetical protein